MATSVTATQSRDLNASIGAAGDELPLAEPRFVITDKEFGQIRDLVHREFGIYLTDRKRALVIGRLQKLLVQLGMKTFSQYIEYLSDPKNKAALSDLANRISTNHTFFFRENEHFRFLAREVLPEIKRRGDATGERDIRVWCAAASSGEEPYSLVMTMMEFFGQEYSRWTAGLLASDISTQVLAKAIAGVYPSERVEQVPAGLRQRYFTKRPDGHWEVCDRLKREVTFRRFNLMKPRYQFNKPMDVVFCRNVLIYFDQPTRVALAHRMYDIMAPGGYLFVGHSETLGRGQTPFTYVCPAIYRKET